MTSYQSRLGAEEGIAEELAESQRAISIAEFFEKNKHMLGFDSGARGLVTAVKEGVDNSLDACEESGILPDIYVEIQENRDYYRVILEDNGPGITKDQIPKIFGKLLYGSRFHKREQSLTPSQELLIRRNGTVETVPIGILCDAYLPSKGDATRRIPDDIEAPSFNRKTHEMTWQPVTHAIRHETDERTYRIETANGRTVEVTGNHSLFSVTDDGETKEVEAGELQPGETILTPRQLPATDEQVREINLLEYLEPSQLAERRLYVSGFSESQLRQLDDSLEREYIENGSLPAETVIERGWEEFAAEQECVLVASLVGENKTTVPVTLPVNTELMKLLGEYISEGHADPRPVGVTAESQEGELVEKTETALALFLETVCGDTSQTKRIPSFMFDVTPERQREFITALYEGDDSHPDTELSHTTPSETLARQLSILWNMQGVPASTEAVVTGGDSDDPSTAYRTTVDGAAVDRLPEDRPPTERLESLCETSTNQQGSNDMCLEEVAAVEEIEPPEYVYDVSVPGETGADENFVVVNDGAISVKNSRGQQGIGISAAVLYSQLTSGKPAKITSRTQGSSEAQYFEVIIDTEENEPEIQLEETTTWERPHGTRIELEMEANMRARQQLHDYIKHTAVVNPHARVELREPNEHFKYERVTDQLPAETSEIRPHPHGVELGTLIKMAQSTDSYSISGFVQGEFTRVGSKTSDSIIERLRDRHFGREMTWRPPQAHESADISAAIEEAVANKGADATRDFAETVESQLTERDRISHHHVVAVVEDVADEIQLQYNTTFGSTVRENAVVAAWEAITAERESDVYALVDAATSKRKDDAVIQALSERIAAKFEVGNRHRVTRNDLREYVDRAAEMTEEHDGATVGETARENIRTELWEAASRVPDDPPTVTDVADDRDIASDLLEAMRETDIMSPPTDCLAPITAELVEAGLRKEYDADFYAASTRDAAVHGGDPFIVEAGLAYGGDIGAEGKADVLRFANRVPLVYQRGACATTDVVKNINWRNYGLDQPGGTGIPNGPVVIMVHVASTNVPFTSESKDAVANVPEIEHEIELALREAARELKSFLNKRRSMQQRRKKQDKLATILPEMAKKLSSVTGREQLNIETTMAQIMNDVLVEREREDGTVSLVVENNGDTNADLEVTEIVTAKPAVENATVVEMDGEWFIKWSPTVRSGETTTLEYELPDEADCSVSVDGIEDEKLTVNA